MYLSSLFVKWISYFTGCCEENTLKTVRHLDTVAKEHIQYLRYIGFYILHTSTLNLSTYVILI